jgi:hypothetical protein
VFSPFVKDQEDILVYLDRLSQGLVFVGLLQLDLLTTIISKLAQIKAINHIS